MRNGRKLLVFFAETDRRTDRKFRKTNNSLINKSLSFVNVNIERSKA